MRCDCDTIAIPMIGLKLSDPMFYHYCYDQLLHGLLYVHRPFNLIRIPYRDAWKLSGSGFKSVRQCPRCTVLYVL